MTIWKKGSYYNYLLLLDEVVDSECKYCGITKKNTYMNILNTVKYYAHS